MNRKLFYATLWSIATVGVAFWVNELIDQSFSAAWMVLVVSAAVEEMAKYLAIRSTRSYSLLIPLVFLIGEETVLIFTPFPFIGNFTVWFFSIALGLFALKHVLFYAPIYALDYKLYSLPIAIVLHIIWNWYAVEGTDVPLGLVCLAVVVWPALALYRWRRPKTAEEEGPIDITHLFRVLPLRLGQGCGRFTVRFRLGEDIPPDECPFCGGKVGECYCE